MNANNLEVQAILRARAKYLRQHPGATEAELIMLFPLPQDLSQVVDRRPQEVRFPIGNAQPIAAAEVILHDEQNTWKNIGLVEDDPSSWLISSLRRQAKQFDKTIHQHMDLMASPELAQIFYDHREERKQNLLEQESVCCIKLPWRRIGDTYVCAGGGHRVLDSTLMEIYRTKYPMDLCTLMLNRCNHVHLVPRYYE